MSQPQSASSDKISRTGALIALSAITLGYIGNWFQAVISHTLLPHGPAVRIPKEDLAVFSSVDFDNNSLINKKQGKGTLTKIYERRSSSGGGGGLIKGPETPIVDPKTGDLYVLTEEANLVSLTNFQPADTSDEDDNKNSDVEIVTAETKLVAHLGVGRPLGGKFDAKGTLYVADALLGLTRLHHATSKNNKEQGSNKSKVEIVASHVTDPETGHFSNILYANDVDIGPKTGHVYFTDSTDIAPDRIGTQTWDTMFAYKLDALRGKRTGRILRYNPESGQIDILATGIFFANGIAVGDKEESFLMVSESTMARQLKYYLKGERKGTWEVMVSEYPGYPDGADCALDTTGLCYVPLPSVEIPLFRLFSKLPVGVSAFLRTILLMLPKEVLNVVKPVKYGGVAEVFPGNGESHVTRILQDSHGKEIGMLTGVAAHENKIYLGSLKNDYIGMFEFD